jgi:hypothetical protein
LKARRRAIVFESIENAPIFAAKYPIEICETATMSLVPDRRLLLHRPDTLP